MGTTRGTLQAKQKINFIPFEQHIELVICVTTKIQAQDKFTGLEKSFGTKQGLP